MYNIEKIFSKNLKALRKRKGFTQKQFASLLDYSEKAVSKWETGVNVPSIDVIFKIANALNVTMDELFYDDERLYYLGVDGGGTKTLFVLTDDKGNEIAELESGPSNPYDIGIEETKKILKASIYEICKDVNLSSVVVFAGIAGCASGKYKEELCKFFDEFHFKAAYSGGDSENIIAAGLGNSNGIALIMGTGICAFTVKDGKSTRTSGWGYLMDKGGSGYNIGRDGLSAAYSDFDKSGEKTWIKELIEKETKKKMPELLPDIYSGGKAYIASFAKIVFEAAEKNDKVAINIIKQNMEETANIIRAAAKPFNEKVKVIIGGGLTKEPELLEYLLNSLADKDKYDIKLLDKRPVDGALFLAKEKFNKRI